ncbi:MAG: chemotaxis protein CheC [Oscillospiraceae bacterium]
MNINNVSELSDIQKEIIKEIGNIGAGNAATSLSSLLNMPVGIKVPNVDILNINDAIDKLGGPENMLIGIVVFLKNDLDGMMMFILEKEFANKSLSILLNKEIKDCNNIDDMTLSALKEISNIVVSSYINTMANFVGLNVNISVPEVCIDMVGAMLNVPATYFEQISEKIIMIKDEITIENKVINSNTLIMPDIKSLNKIISKLGF